MTRKMAAMRIMRAMNFPKAAQRMNNTIPMRKASIMATSLPVVTLLFFYLNCKKLAKTSGKCYPKRTIKKY